jgi:hypothetical protein
LPGGVITAEKLNANNLRIQGAVNVVSTAVEFNQNLATLNKFDISRNQQITGTLTNQVNSFIPLPTGCTAGQTITFDGSAWACADVPPLLPVGCMNGQTIKYGGGAWNCHD